MAAMVANIMAEVRQTGCEEPAKPQKSWLSFLTGSFGLCQSSPAILPDLLQVQLVVTPIGPQLPRQLQAYHTSVIIGDQELSFGLTGLCLGRGPASHKHLPRSSETVVSEVGLVSSVDASTLKRKLRPFFRKDSYDLLRKNCNSFSDVCLAVLVGARLDEKYRKLEEAALSLDSYLGLVRIASGGNYKPNPEADAFQVVQVVSEIKNSRSAAPVMKLTAAVKDNPC